MEKQTAVEWLETKIIKFHNWKQNPIYDENCFDEIELNKAIQQAKELEKQQIVDAYRVGKVEATLPPEKLNTGGKYYRELFKPE